MLLDEAIERAREYAQEHRIYPKRDMALALGLGYLIGSKELPENYFYTETEIKHILARGDLSAAQLAKQLGITTRQLYKLIDLDKPRIPETIIKKVCALKKKGRPNKYIVNELGLTRKQVSYIIQRYYYAD